MALHFHYRRIAASHWSAPKAISRFRSIRALVLAAALIITLLRAGAAELLRMVASVKDDAKTLAFSPDSSMLASGGGYTESIGSHGEVKIWSVPELEKTAEFRGHKAEVIGVGFIPKTQKLVSGASEIVVFDPKTRAVDATIRTPGIFHTFKLSPNGHIAVTIARGDKAARVWDLQTGKCVALLTCAASQDTPQPWIRLLAFSTDGSIMATRCDTAGTLDLWDTTNWVRAGRVPITSITGKSIHLLFSPITNSLFIADSVGLFVDTRTGRELRRLQSTELYAHDVAWSPDGQIVAVAKSLFDEGHLTLWNAGTGKLLKTVEGPRLSVAFSPTGKFLACGTRHGTLELYEVNPEAMPR